MKYVVYFLVGVGFAAGWYGNHPEEEVTWPGVVGAVIAWPLFAGAAIASLDVRTSDGITD